MSLEGLLPIALFLLFALLAWLGEALGRVRARRGRGGGRRAPPAEPRGRARDQRPARGGEEARRAPARIEATPAWGGAPPAWGGAPPSRTEGSPSPTGASPSRLDAPPAWGGAMPSRTEGSPSPTGASPSRLDAPPDDRAGRRASAVDPARRSTRPGRALRRKDSLRAAFVWMAILDRRVDRAP